MKQERAHIYAYTQPTGVPEVDMKQGGVRRSVSKTWMRGLVGNIELLAEDEMGYK